MIVAISRLVWLLSILVVFWQSVIPQTVEISGLINDKVAHFLIFFFLLVFAAFPWRKQKHRIVIVLFLCLYGVLIEIVQYYIPARSFSIVDWLADLTGLLTALMIIRLVNV